MKFTSDHQSDFLEQISKARKNVFKRWVIDPSASRTSMGIDIEKDVSFGEWHAALDEIEERIAECRAMRDGFDEEEEEDLPF